MSEFDSSTIYFAGADNVTGHIRIDSTHVSIWRRLWFLLSAIPRYLISGSVEVP